MVRYQSARGTPKVDIQSSVASSLDEAGEDGDGIVRLPLDSLLPESGFSTDKPDFKTKRDDDDMTGRATRQSTGKLKKLNSRGSLPAPTGRSTRSQRPLGRPQARPDTYALEESPEKPILKPTRRLLEPPQYSPLRVQRRGQRQEVQAEQAAGATQSDSEPSHEQDQSSDGIVVQSPRQSPARPSDAGKPEEKLVSADATAAEQDSEADSQADSSPAPDEQADEGLFVQDYEESQADPSRGGQEAASTVHDFADAPATTGAERTPTHPKKRLVPEKVRPSELYSPAKETAGDEEGASEAQVQAAPRLKPKPLKQKKKRQREGTTDANAPRPKRRETGIPEVPGDEEADVTEMPERQTHDRRLLGQMSKIHSLVHATKRVGVATKNGQRVRYELRLEDDQVKAAYKLCNQANQNFTRLIKEPDNVQMPDPPPELDQIAVTIRRLCGKDNHAPPDYKDQTRSENIYFHLIPRLVRLLRRMAECYLAIDEDEGTGDVSVTPGHLEIISQMIELILDMGDGAQRYVRPDSSLAIVNSVKRGLIDPLVKVQEKFRGHMARVEEDEERAALRALEDQRRAQEQLHEEEQAAQQERIEQLRLKWSRLHEERRWVEPGIIPLSKQKHLRIPDPEPMPEVDQNGEQFERIQLFGHRVCPPPALVDEVWRQPWTEEEILALCTGLRDYSGPSVFPKIFRRFCVSKGVLNKYNVSQIVTMAAGIKENERRHQLEQNGYVEDWVEAIPEWTIPHLLLGSKENVDDGNAA